MSTFRQLLTAVGIMAVGFSLSACNTTKATVDTTVNFFSSTTPSELFSQDGLVKQEQKINLFAGVAYENLRQESAAGGGQYVSSLAALYHIPTDRQQEFAWLLQSKHADLFASDLSVDRTAHLKMVDTLNQELKVSSILNH